MIYTIRPSQAHRPLICNLCSRLCPLCWLELHLGDSGNPNPTSIAQALCLHGLQNPTELSLPTALLLTKASLPLGAQEEGRELPTQLMSHAPLSLAWPSPC